VAWFTVWQNLLAKPKQQRRVQLRRAKGWRMPANTVKVDRTTLFGNPFSVKEHGHDRAVALHRAWLTGRSIGKGLSKELLRVRSPHFLHNRRCAQRPDSRSE
jgi:Domain of unknown function (DUF4326)